MPFHFAPEQNYDCVQCGRGCQAGWEIPVEPHIYKGLENSPLTLRVIQDHGASPLRVTGNKATLNLDPRCAYHEDDMLCGVHKQMGFAAKPMTCRLYPFIITETPDGHYVGVTYSCTAARANHGRPSAAHEADVQAMVAEGCSIFTVGADQLTVHSPWFTTWEDYKQLEAWLLPHMLPGAAEAAVWRVTSSLISGLAALPKPRATSPRPLPAPLAELVLHSAQLEMREVVLDLLMGALPLLPFAFQASPEGAVRTQRYGWQGDLAQLQELMHAPLSAELEAEIERYLLHLVHRKTLVTENALTANACLLSALPAFLRLVTRWQSATPELAHYYEALDAAEKYLVYHAVGLRPHYARVSRRALDRLRSHSTPAAPVSGS